MIHNKNISRQQPDQYHHLIPPMTKALKFTAKATWYMMKTLVKAAWLIPGAVRRAAGHDTAPKPTRVDMPSPDTAFP